MRWRLLLIALVACSSKAKQAPAPRCDLGSAANASFNARPQMLVDSCPVCDWKTILAWSDNATRSDVLQKALESCDAFCTGDSKMKFMAGVDAARGTANDTPWRKLAQACGDKVDAATDHRFMSAPYFALDRIGRALAKANALELDTLVVPLPAQSVAGTGVLLPTVDVGGGASDPIAPVVPDVAITLLGEQILVANLPSAKLGANGVEVNMGKEPYPGKAVSLADVPATLTAMTGGDKSKWVALLAPTSMPADKLVPVVAAAAPVVSLHLAVAAPKSPAGWQLPAVLATPLSIADNGVQVTADMPVQKLVAMLVANGTGTLEAK